MSKPLISVVIPAYNEENNIESCLESITNQELAQDEYEVIVVNNNSSDDTANIVSQHFPKVKLINEEKQGVVFARIKGVAEAKGSIIAFIDADCIASKLWLKNIKEAYRKPNIVAVGGYIIYEPKLLASNIAEKVTNTFCSIVNIMTAANFSFKKEVYLKCGGFSPKINLNEDIYLSLALRKYGKIIALKNNPIITSSRRFTSSKLILYFCRSVINVLFIFLFKKSIFFDFEAIRDNKLSVKKIVDKVKGRYLNFFS